MDMIKNNKYLNCNSLWIFIFCAMLGVFLIVTPKYNDDWWYMSGFKDWFDSQGIWFPTDGGNPFSAGVPWHEYWKTLVYHYNVDNIRLSNIFGTFFLLFPKWVGSGIALVMWAVAMIYTFRFIGVDICRSWLVCAGLLMWCLFMPWRESMGGLIYQFNYLVPSGIYMYLLCVAWNLNGRGKQMWRLFVFGLIAGAWHEGFAIPVIIGLMIVFVMFKKYRTPGFVSILCGVATGLIWLVLCPGIYERMDNTDRLPLSLGYIADQISQNSVILVGLIAFVFFIIKNGWNSFAGDSRLVFMTVSGISSFVLAVFTSGSARAAWWCDIVVIAAVLYILNKFAKLRDICNIRCLLMKIVLLVPCFMVLLFSDIYAINISRDYRRIISDYRKESRHVAFSKIVARHPWPLIYRFFADNYNVNYTMFVNAYYEDPYYLRIVPENLRNIREEDGNLIPGDIGIRVYDGSLYVSFDKLDYHPYITKVDFGWGGKVSWAYTTTVPFVSYADGRTYIFVDIWACDTRLTLGSIRRMDYNKEAFK